MSWTGQPLNDDPVAELHLIAVLSDGSSVPVHATVYLPIRVGEDSACGCEVRGLPIPGGDSRVEAGGVDSWQSLQLALQMVRDTLQRAVDQHGVRFERFDEPVDPQDLFTKPREY